MRSKKLATFLFLAVAMATVAFAAACGDDDDGGGNSVNVTLSEWAIAPSASSASAGEITFKANNIGTMEHEFIVIKTDTPADKLTINGTKVDEDDAGEVIGEIEVDAGKDASDSWELDAGKYVFICNIEGHYESGMYAGFTVN